MKRLTLLILAFALILTTVILNGCAERIQAKSLMDGIEGQETDGKASDDTFVNSQMALALKLMDEICRTKKNENVMISPLSIALALSMTANGASGQTLHQMETLLGINIGDLNEYMYSYVKSLEENSSDNAKISLAYSIWFRDANYLKVNDTFLQKNATYYGADAYRAPFDETTVSDINNWVNTNTNGLIKKIIDGIKEDMMLYLINTISFDAEWANLYEESDIKEGTFTDINGNKTTVDMLHSNEYGYISLENATGFIKNYNGRKFSFVALLPSENMTPAELLSTLDGQTLINAVKNRSNESVNTKMPSFKTNFDMEINDVLIALGMKNAFDKNVIGDFNNMATIDSDVGGDLYIGAVIHKTHITVDAKGTKAGAVTSVGMSNATGSPDVPKKSVILDRPFVYMIIDNATNIPMFIGCLNNLS